MAENGLANAKAKLNEATEQMKEDDGTDFDKVQIIEQKFHDALYIAGEALAAFRREGNSEKKIEALDVILEANLALGDTFSAVIAANDELAMIRRTGDKKALVKVLDMLGRVQVTRGDSLQAMELFQELLDLQKELGDKEGEAKALRLVAEQNLALKRDQEAMKQANAALAMFQDLGSKDGEDEVKRTISRIYSAMKMPEKAPNRGEAKAAIQDLYAAVDNKDGQAWKAAMEALLKSGAYTDKDINEITQKAVEDNDKGAKTFLAEMGLAGLKKESMGQVQACEVIKRMTYIQFRLGGLGYGPRFRCLQAHGLHVPDLDGDEYKANMKALAVLQVSDEAEDWEKELGYQPGILDGLLQSMTGMAACVPNSVKQAQAKEWNQEGW
jgi:tetratricopeptide (TPR) repeat protein